MSEIDQLIREIDALRRRVASLEAMDSASVWAGSKDIGDNTATGIMTVDCAPITVAADAMDALVQLSFINRFSGAPGYTNVGEVWLIALRYYQEGGVYYAAGTPVLVQRADAGSKSGAYADIGNATVTVTYAANVFTVKVQADHTGASGGTVVCEWRAEVLSNNLGALTIAAL